MFRCFRTSPPPRWALLGLACVTAMAAAMRLYGLANQSLWFDEMCSWHTATQPTLAGVWSGDIRWNMYPPLYGFVLRAAIALLGDAEWAMRLPSAIAGIAVVPLMYAVAARIYGDAEGLLAAGFAAFSMFTLYFAQEARPYALLLCAVLIAVLSWTYVHDAWANGRRAPRAALAGCFAASVCAAYLHYFGLLFVLLHGIAAIALLARTPRGFVRAAALYGAAALAFLPWLPSMLWHLRHQAEGPQNPPIDANVFVSFWQYLNSLFNHGQTASAHATAAAWVALALTAFALVCEVAARRNAVIGESNIRLHVTRAMLLAAWLLLPFLIAYVKSSTSASVFTHRNLIVSLPAAYVLAARGAALLPLRGKVTAVVGAVVLAAMCARTVTAGYYTAPHKDQLREAVAVVASAEAQHPDAALAVYGQLPFTFDYYLERSGSALRPSAFAGKAGDIEAMRALVRERKPAAVWYLCTEPYPDTAFTNFLDTDFTIARHEQFLRADALLLVPKRSN